MPIIKPNFVIAGATRSGTTSLFYYLKQHPEIAFPKIKEPRYFSSINIKLPQNGPGDNTVDEKLVTDKNNYYSLYEQLIGYKRIGDASSEYLYHYEYTAELIRHELGDVPIIIILRNPVERAYSAYNNLVRDGRETMSFSDALKAEENRISENWDMMWAYKKVGLYYKQVKKYLESFTNVKVLIFEEFVMDPDKYMKEIFLFLGVRSDIKVDVEIKYSHSGKPKNQFIGWLTGRNNRLIYPVRKKIVDLLPRNLLEIMASKMYNKTAVPEDIYIYMYDYYKSDIEKLEILIGREISYWR